jgi:hypothetical protein
MQPAEPFQGTDLRSYYLGVIDRFDSISNIAYTPNLDLLDKMIGSLDVHPTGISDTPGMPSTGADTEWMAAMRLRALAGVMLCTGALLHSRRSD